MVGNVLGEFSQNAAEREFHEQMSRSEAANAAHAQHSLAELAARRGMSAGDVEGVAQTYLDATGQPLRYDLLAIMPEHRDGFLNEVAVQAEAGERADRMQRFAASLFAAPSTDIPDGLRIKDGVPRDLPPILLDEGYAFHRATQAVRREDAERPSRPSRATDDDIRRSLLSPEGTDIAAGLTDDSGRRTSFSEIAAKDPDSTQNVQARQRQRDAMRISNLTGARRV